MVNAPPGYFFPPIFLGRQSFVLFLMQFVLASRQLSVTIGVSLGVSRAVLLLFWFLVFLNSFQRLVFFHCVDYDIWGIFFLLQKCIVIPVHWTVKFM